MIITKRLNTWHRYRVPVLEAMIALEGEIAYHRAEEQRLRPRYGEIAVGSADFDHLLNATIAEEFIRVIRRGDTPEVACREAKKASRDCITKWNAYGCRSRAVVVSHAELQLSESTGDGYAEILQAKFALDLPRNL